MLMPRGRDVDREIAEQEAFRHSERERAERRAAVVFDSLVDSSPVSIEIYSVTGVPLRSNKAAERLLGKVPPPGIPLFEERGLKRAGLLEPQLKRVLAGARVETPPFWYDATEIGLPGIPGRKVFCRATVFPVFDHEGAVSRIVVMHEDLSEIKKLEQALQETRAAVAVAPVAASAEPSEPPGDARDVEFARRKLEQALREAEERYRMMVESAQGCVYARLTDDGRILALSPSISELTGISRDAILTDNSLLFAQVHPDDVARLREVELEARRIGTYPSGHRFRFQHKKTDAVYWVELRGSASSFASRRTFDLLLLDVTSQKRTEDLLEEKEVCISQLLASEHEPFFVIDKDWTVVAWSPAVARDTRVSVKEAVGRRLWDVYPDLEKSGFALPFRKTLLEREPQHKEGFYQDGREKYAGWFSMSTWPFGTGVVALMRNVSQRRKAEQAWQDADSRLRALMDSPILLVAFKDSELKYVAANATARRLLGASASGEMIGKTDAELFPSAVTGLLGTHDRQVIERGEAVTLELALGDPKSEATVWLSLSKLPWRTAGGDVQGVVDVGFDISRFARATQELTRRREYLGRLLSEQSEVIRKANEELNRWSR